MTSLYDDYCQRPLLSLPIAATVALSSWGRLLAVPLVEASIEVSTIAAEGGLLSTNCLA